MPKKPALPNLEQDDYQAQVSIESSRLAIIDSLAVSLGFNRDQVLRLALMMGLSKLAHFDNSLYVHEKVSNREKSD